MAQSLLELSVGTGKWDAGLKKAQSALNNFVNAQGGLQQALDKDNGDMAKFVKMMGNISSSANTAKGQMNDYKRALEQLTTQYNMMSDAQKKSIGPDYLQAIEALKAKFQQAKMQVDDFNRSIGDIKAPTISGGGGGLFSGDKLSGMLQVFGGNMMTKAVSWAASFASEMGNCVKQGIELAKQGEGIRMAFERLGRGDILNGLRDATHGTVTDLELMKAAVKFNDFKLPLEELGTMLAFAQQKAKDTGQSVDYMVDSIVTGLGRKSLMILDNLGLSAAEIKDKMKETGDMTKAVGAIIREQMAKAGDYVETAADRAKKADVELKNAMEELGRTFQPLTDSASNMWNNIKIGCIDLLNNAVKPLINAFTEASRLRKEFEKSSKTNVDRMIANLGDGQGPKALELYNRQLATFDRVIAKRRRTIAALGDDAIESGIKKKEQKRLAIDLAARAEYVRRANELHKNGPQKATTETPQTPETTGGKGGSGGGKTDTIQGFNIKDLSAATWGTTQSMKELQQQLANYKTMLANATDQFTAGEANAGISATQRLIAAQPTALKMGISVEAAADMMDQVESIKDQIEEGVKIYLKATMDTESVEDVATAAKAVKINMKDAASMVNTLGSALSAIEDPGAKVAATVAQAIATIAMAYSDALAKDSSSKFNIWSFIAAAAAATVSMATTIASIHSATGYAEGGIIKGNTYSGDQIPADSFVNAGELVLNKAQQLSLASQLTDRGRDSGGGASTPYVTGEKIVLGINNWAKRNGRGELVFSR